MSASFPLFESIRHENGIAHLLSLHLERMHSSCKKIWGTGFALEDELIRALEKISHNEKHKVRVNYTYAGFEIQVEPYQKKIIQSIRFLTDDTIQYDLKWTDRKLFQHSKQEHVELIFVREGYLTDATYANLALFDGEHWYTPDTPLLQGVRRAHLLAAGKLQVRPIRHADIHHYQSISLINALLDLEELVLPIC
jgi:4-amino-4-deoxychorismate lyase